LTVVPPIDPWSLVLSGAGFAATHPTEIQETWDRIWSGLTQQNAKIVVTGLPGVGKTVLLDHIAGRASTPTYQLPGRSYAPEKERLKHEKQRWAITVMPGQKSPVRTESIEKAFNHGRKIDGVIHVVANGYSSLRDPIAEQILVEEGGTLARHRKEQMDLELTDFDSVAAEFRRAIQRKSNHPWLLVAVNKWDLFSDDTATKAAKRYYGMPGGTFYSRVDELGHEAGSDNLSYEIVAVASWLEDFTYGTEVAKFSMRTDQRNRSLLNLVRTISSLCERA